MTDQELKAFKTALMAECAALIEAREGTSADRAPVELDQQSIGRVSRIDAIQQQAMARAQDARRGVRARLIAAALRRIQEDEYGYCVACGEEIPIARLKIDPACAQCVACAR